jgi:PadR family transcriptional regulator, regulatory protein AphA
MARTSSTPFVILGILGLSEAKPLSGYDIKQVIDSTISHFWSESYGQIYPMLKQMTGDKLIRARTVKDSGRRKVVYTLMPKGRKSLSAWMEKAPEIGPARDELILKLFFGSQTGAPVLIRHLERHRERFKAVGEQYAAWLKQSEGQSEKLTPYQQMTLRAGVAMSTAFVQWADESVATLQEMENEK